MGSTGSERGWVRGVEVERGRRWRQCAFSTRLQRTDLSPFYSRASRLWHQSLDCANTSPKLGGSHNLFRWRSWSSEDLEITRRKPRYVNCQTSGAWRSLAAGVLYVYMRYRLYRMYTGAVPCTVPYSTMQRGAQREEQKSPRRHCDASSTVLRQSAAEGLQMQALSCQFQFQVARVSAVEARCALAPAESGLGGWSLPGEGHSGEQ